MVAISRTVGNAEKSSGRWIHNATMRMRTEKAIENDKPKSKINDGTGRNKTVKMTTMPAANPTSLPENLLLLSVEFTALCCTCFPSICQTA